MTKKTKQLLKSYGIDMSDTEFERVERLIKTQYRRCYKGKKEFNQLILSYYGITPDMVSRMENIIWEPPKEIKNCY